MSAKSNNFDLIRLLAAMQVAIVHSMHHLGITPQNGVFMMLTSFFPGVPIFFFVSGFLISQSFDRNPSIPDFVRNRWLRIYPALIVCFAASVLSVLATGYFGSVPVDWKSMLAWVAAQLTFLQFYNPGFMRHYGTGVLNGSVWTICVELQFYALTPVFQRLINARGWGNVHRNARWLGLIVIFVILNQVYSRLGPTHDESLWFKLLGVTFIPWVYMFLVGAFAQSNFAFFRSGLVGRGFTVIAVYLAIAVCAEYWLNWGFGNLINPLLFVALALVVFTAAFSRPTASDHVIRRNDISYGVYIYHMPVVNLLLAVGLGGSGRGLWVAIFATGALALLSWILVEKPALAFKRHPLYRH
jgi:peptidoglycan/LPS O-acetylase OafA/YrhL